MQTLTAAQALQNADSFSFFGLIAGLADLYWRLDTGNATNAQQGVLIKDLTIPQPQKKMRRRNVRGQVRTRTSSVARMERGTGVGV